MEEQDKPGQDETASKRTAIDWERIEGDFRAGILSLREIAANHPGVNHVAITRRAKKEGWTRDLSEKIQAKADELVTRQVVTPGVTARRSVSDRQIIDANATRIAQVRSEHRQDISRSRTLVMTLLGELEGACTIDSRETLQGLKDMLRKPGDEISAGMARVISEQIDRLNSLPGRAKVLKDLCDSLRVLIALEREAYGLSVEKDGESQSGGKSSRSTQTLTDAERAVRLHALLTKSQAADAK